MLLRVVPLLLLAIAPNAQAYVQPRAASGEPLRWAESCLFLSPTAGGSEHISQTDMVEALHRATGQWRGVIGHCAYLELDVAEVVETRGVGSDFINHVEFLNEEWGVVEPDGAYPFEPNAEALTILTYVDDETSEDDGRLVDADLVLNAVWFRFGIVERDGDGVVDLENTLVHELGHVLGLDHVCHFDPNQPRPNDHRGQPIPDCDPVSILEPEIVNATMFPRAEKGETGMRTPELDDASGVCAIYPLTQDPERCEPVFEQPRAADCDCQVGRGNGGLPRWAQIPALLLVALLLMRRRRTGGAWLSLRE